MRLGQFLIVCSGVAILALSTGTARAGEFKVLHSLCGARDGCNPQSPLAIDTLGNLYGTTVKGGRGYGTVFELERKASGRAFKFKVLFHFRGGLRPAGPVILDAQGNLYGLLRGEVSGGAVFKLLPQADKRQWTEQVLYHFCSQLNCTDGNVPQSGLTYSGASNGAPYDGASPLYGVTQSGGANNEGTAFQLINDNGTWREMVMYNFCSQGGDKCTDGRDPFGGLLVDTSGTLFGTAYQGGKENGGTAFQLSPSGASWTYTLLYTFCSAADCADGAGPDEPFVLDAKGNLLSTASGGGAHCHFSGNNCGTIFQLSVADGVWQETVLYSFCHQKDCKDGAGPSGLVIDGEGNIFGTTGLGGYYTADTPLGGGTAFEFSDSSLKILHRFCSADGCADGYRAVGGLIPDASGNLFGTTERGGTYGDDFSGGTVFRVTRKVR